MLSSEQKIKTEKEILKLVMLFLKTNASDKELSAMTGIPCSTVGRRLNDEERIVALIDRDNIKIPDLEMADIDETYGAFIYGEIKRRRKINLLEAKHKGGKTFASKKSFVKLPSGEIKNVSKIDLKMIYKNEDSQIKFITLAALTFRLNLDSLSELLNRDKDSIYNEIIAKYSIYYGALMFLFNNDPTDQMQAKTNFRIYYLELLEALKAKDIKEVKRLLAVIGDKRIIELKNTLKKGTPISDEQIKVMLEFQLKYAYTAHQIADMLEINRSNYIRRINKLKEQYPELVTHYELLADFHKYNFLKGNRRQ